MQRNHFQALKQSTFINRQSEWFYQCTSRVRIHSENVHVHFGERFSCCNDLPPPLATDSIPIVTICCTTHVPVFIGWPTSNAKQLGSIAYISSQSRSWSGDGRINLCANERNQSCEPPAPIQCRVKGLYAALHLILSRDSKLEILLGNCIVCQQQHSCGAVVQIIELLLAPSFGTVPISWIFHKLSYRPPMSEHSRVCYWKKMRLWHPLYVYSMSLSTRLDWARRLNLMEWTQAGSVHRAWTWTTG